MTEADENDITHAMILAAGLGTRMRPLTNDRPKPLVEVAGRPIIDYGLDAVKAGGLDQVIVNMHYFAEQIENWAKGVEGIDIILSDETDELLETGGGVNKVLPIFEEQPFFVLNSDSFWTEKETPALRRMKEFWNPAKMDCLMLLSALDRCTGFSGLGDFVFEDQKQSGVIKRFKAPGSGEQTPYAYTGCCLMSPQLFKDAPMGAFSLNVLWDMALHRKRLFGLVHEGLWLHVGTPDAIGAAEHALETGQCQLAEHK